MYGTKQIHKGACRIVGASPAESPPQGPGSRWPGREWFVGNLVCHPQGPNLLDMPVATLNLTQRLLQEQPLLPSLETYGLRIMDLSHWFQMLGNHTTTMLQFASMARAVHCSAVMQSSQELYRVSPKQNMKVIPPGHRSNVHTSQN